MQRYGPDELDRIAEENRDRAIGLLTRLTGREYADQASAIMMEVSARVAVAEFCRRDATRMRQLAPEQAKHDQM